MRYPHIYEICEKKDTRCYCPTEEQKIKDKEEINHILISRIQRLMRKIWGF